MTSNEYPEIKQHRITIFIVSTDYQVEDDERKEASED